MEIALSYGLGLFSTVVALGSIATSLYALSMVGVMRKEMSAKDIRIAELERLVEELRKKLKELGHEAEMEAER